MLWETLSLFDFFCKMLCIPIPLQKGYKLEHFATFELLFAFPVLSSFLVLSVSASQLPSSFVSEAAVCYVFLSAPRKKKSKECVNICYNNHY